MKENFAPWIVYWVLCSMENELGVVISLATSLFLVTLQIHKRDFNFMEVVTLLYWFSRLLHLISDGSNITCHQTTLHPPSFKKRLSRNLLEGKIVFSYRQCNHWSLKMLICANDICGWKNIKTRKV